MTVRELKEILNKYNDNMTILMENIDYGDGNDDLEFVKAVVPLQTYFNEPFSTETAQRNAKNYIVIKNDCYNTSRYWMNEIYEK